MHRAGEKQRLKVVNEEIPPNYESYLQRIQRRNARLRQLKSKSKNEIEAEKREGGFSLYFSGANQEPGKFRSARLDSKKTPRFGGPMESFKQPQSRPSETTSYLRSKTAPDLDKRKEWAKPQMVTIKTGNGGFVSARAPDLYSEDFDDNDDDNDDSDQNDHWKPNQRNKVSTYQVRLSNREIHALRVSMSQSGDIPEDIQPILHEEALSEVEEDCDFVMELNTSEEEEAAGARQNNKAAFLDSQQKLQYIVSKVKSLSEFQHKQLLQVLDDLDVKQPPPSSQSALSNVVRFLLISNWGHLTDIGLTEVDFYGVNNTKLPVSKATLWLDGQLQSQEDLSALYNGKTKTKKERFMWRRSVASWKGSVEILFELNVNKVEACLSKIDIWNYNKSMEELNVGVQRLQVYLVQPHRLLFDGTVERGCGNHVFDYRMTVAVPGRHTSSPQTRDELSPETDELLEEEEDNDLESAASMFRKYQKPVTVHRGNKRAEDSSDSGKSSSECVSNKITSPKGARVSVVVEKSSENQLSQSSSSWLEEVKQSAMKNSLDDFLNEEPLDGNPMEIIRSQRAKRLAAAGMERGLEKSWSSISFFNRSQAGRISIDFQGDALDDCLKRIKPEKDKSVKKPTASSSSGGGGGGGNNNANNPSETAVPSGVCDIDELLKEETDSGWSDDEFVIPELPEGRQLTMNILSTWGDKYYVGLTGIEVFSDKGRPVVVKEISANPADINVLPGYGADPRVVTNLIDGVNNTKDDVHMWLTPFTPHKNHFVSLTFEAPARIAMIRLWNYNKSRVHFTRGARYIEMQLDDQFIFKGEIRRAVDMEGYGETILFTTDDDILEKVASHDQVYVNIEEAEAEIVESLIKNLEQRPSTADLLEEDDTKEEEEEAGALAMTGRSHTLLRPHTCAAQAAAPTRSQPTHANHSPSSSSAVITCKQLELNFLETWGDGFYLGLTELKVLHASGQVIPLTMDMLQAQPTDLTVLPGYENDPRTLDKLIDGCGVTQLDEHMWLIPFTPGEGHIVTIQFPHPTPLGGLKIWNYNKSSDDSYRGAKLVQIRADQQALYAPQQDTDAVFLLRKAPGHCHFDFGQEISFKQHCSANRFLQLAADTADSNLPQGFVYQFNLFSSWGDPYYIGLNGVELYDADGVKLLLTSANVAAFPDSVNCLLDVSSGARDVRTPDKLIDGENDTQDGQHMWLAPILPGQLNRIYFMFDTPVMIGMIKLWNYSKTPQRGVREFSLLVDDLLLFSSTVPMYAAPQRGGILPNCSAPQAHHTILLDRRNEKLLLREKQHLLVHATDLEEDVHHAGQDVMLTNDRQIVAQYKQSTSGAANQELRPKTSVYSRRLKR